MSAALRRFTGAYCFRYEMEITTAAAAAVRTYDVHKKNTQKEYETWRIMMNTQNRCFIYVTCVSKCKSRETYYTTAAVGIATYTVEKQHRASEAPVT